jgi:hypothetical protein
MATIKGPGEYETWTAEDQEILDGLIKKMDEHFQNKDQRELNMDINTSSGIGLHVWDRFVQEANEAGWDASRKGAQIRIKRPSKSGFTIGTVERG